MISQPVPIDFYGADLGLVAGASSEQLWREANIWCGPDGVNGFGGVANVGGITASSNATVGASATALQGWSATTNTTNGNICRLDYGANFRYFCFNHNVQFVAQMAISSITSVRVWCGICSADGGTQGASLTPSTSYAAFRFSTGAGGNSNWTCCTDNGSGTPNVIDSGVAATTSDFLFGLRTDAGTGLVRFYINSVQVATTTTKVDTSTTTLFPVLCLTLLAGGSSKTLTWRYVNTRVKAT